MNHEEFGAQMQRLVSVYSDRAFPTDRIQIIWQAVKNYPDRTFQVAVDDIIGDCMQPPNLSKIREYLMAARKKTGDHADVWQPIRDQLAAAESAKNDEGWCHQCFNSGTFMAHLKDDPHKYLRVFTCDCRWGELAASLPENKGKAPEWSVLTAKTWQRENATPPPRRPDEPPKAEARDAIKSLFRSTDLRKTLDGNSGPKRARDLAHDFDPEL